MNIRQAYLLAISDVPGNIKLILINQMYLVSVLYN